MIKVTKRDGTQEELNLDKIHKILFFACDGISNVSVSEIEIRSKIQFFDGIDTKTIHKILIKAASELISEDTPNYQYVAGRLLNYSIRKDVYGSYDPVPFLEHVKKLVDAGVYDPEILEKYTEQELNELGKYIKHKRDDKFTYVAMKQWEGKYLCKNRSTGEIFESPQMAYMMISACLFMKYAQPIRMKYVKKFYDAISNFDISLPTPIMGGLRTCTRQFSSCVTISCGDSLESIASTNHAIMRYISRKAGIGINYGRVRAVGSEIRGGDAVHTGVIPFLSAVAKTVKSCSQGGLRGGAATVYFPLWHYEFDDIVVLKNNKGTEFNRVRQLDYAFQLNGLMYQRLIENGDITFFSPSDVPGLYDAFCQDQEKFKVLYEKYEQDNSIRKKVKPALEVFSALLTERAETGRIYIQNIDHTNVHSPFISEKAPIEQSNLCCEIALPTKPFESVDSGDGLISLCTLAAINWGNFSEPEEMEESCDLVVRALDELLDYQDYPIGHAKHATDLYRPLGVGIVNLAYFLAKRGLKYDDNALSTVDKWAEAWSYYLTKASVELAKEKGMCDGFNDLKYSLGILPIDTYKDKKTVLVDRERSMDWDSLREEILEHGIRNATLMSLMPSETSSQISNSTSGIEKVRSLVTTKGSKDGILKQVVPEIAKLKDKYDMLWDQSDNSGYLKISSVLQRYIDQSISANTSYNPSNYESKKVSMHLLLKELVLAYQLSIKNLYYHNTQDGSGEIDVEKSTETKPVILPPMDDESDCDSCKI